MAEGTPGKRFTAERVASCEATRIELATLLIGRLCRYSSSLWNALAAYQPTPARSEDQLIKSCAKKLLSCPLATARIAQGGSTAFAKALIAQPCTPISTKKRMTRAIPIQPNIAGLKS